jgi:hypothetical protein
METRIFIIDVETWAAKKTFRRLKALKSTVSIADMGQYRECPEESRIHLETTLSEKELEDRMYNGNYEYTGIIEKTTPPSCSAANCHDECLLRPLCEQLQKIKKED